MMTYYQIKRKGLTPVYNWNEQTWEAGEHSAQSELSKHHAQLLGKPAQLALLDGGKPVQLGLLNDEVAE